MNTSPAVAIARRSQVRKLISKTLFFVALLWPAMHVAYASCFVAAGEKFGIDPLLLRAIALTESSMNPHALNRNKNGSEDIGMMQINSMHLDRLSKHGITRDVLLTDACVSVVVGAEILSEFIAQYGYTWRAVGAYNAGTGEGRDALRERYAMKVVRAYLQLKRQGKYQMKK